MVTPIPSGLCQCGCGQPTRVPKYDNPARGYIAGVPRRYVFGHHMRKPAVDGYRRGTLNGRRMRLHRLRAELALGKPLARRHPVHHADGSKSDDAPLVICQDNAYHMLLHHRMRLVAAGADPDRDGSCSRCETVKPRGEFRITRGMMTFSWCRACENAWRHEKQDRLRISGVADGPANQPT